MLASLLFIASVGSSALNAVQDPTLNLEFPGGTLSTLAGEIESQTGWKVKIHPDVANDVVVVYTNGKSADDTIKQLAKATATQWNLNGEEMTVLPDITLRQQQEQVELQKYAQEIAKQQKEYLESVKKRTIKDDESGEEWDYEPGLEQRILAGLVANVAPGTLARVKPGERLVLSSNANRMQLALGRFNPQDIQAWIEEYNEGVRSMNEMEIGNSEEMGIEQEIWEMYMNQPKPEEIKEAPAKLLLVITRPTGNSYWSGGGLLLNAKVIGASGKTLLETQAGLGQGYAEMYATPAMADGVEVEGDQEEQAAPKRPGDDIKLTYPEEVKTVKEAWRMDFNPNTAKFTMDPKIREIMLRPDLYEPMRYEMGESMLQTAKALKKSFIAVIPDTNSYMGSNLFETVGEVRDMLEYYELAESEENGWMNVLPTKPSEVRKERVSRVSLAKLLAYGQNRIFLPLDPIADFVYQNPNAGENSLVTTSLNFFAPQIFMSMYGSQTSTDHLRLYGSLNMPQRKALRAGTPLQIAQMTQATRSIVELLVYGAQTRLNKIDAATILEQKTIASSFSEMYTSWDSYGSSGQEPTEFFPNGLPPTGRLAMKSHISQYIVPVSEDGHPMRMNMPFGRSELAVWGLMSKNPGFMAELGNMATVMQNMRAGNRTEIKFAVLLTPEIGFSGDLVDIDEPDMSKRYSWQNLPPELQAQVNSDIAELEKSPFGKMMQMAGSGGFGGTPPIKP